jgi:acetyl esterase/lipase
MTDYRLDDQIAGALARFPQELLHAPDLAPGDIEALRRRIDLEYAEMSKIAPATPAGVDREDVIITASDGAELPARWYTNGDARPGSAVVYAHGGGQVAGTLDHYERWMREYVAETWVPILSVDYRLAPESKGPQLSEDVLSAVSWVAAHASRLGVNPSRIALMGDSGGGTLAAGASILARDRGIPVALQILIYPMLDDRVTVASPGIEPFLGWTAPMNATAWQAVVDGPVSAVTAPARLEDARGLPAAYIEVGDLDLFRDESLAYGLKLASADVPLELHVHPAVPHGYEWMDEQAAVVQRALADRYRVLRSL